MSKNSTIITVNNIIANPRVIKEGYTILNPNQLSMEVTGDVVLITTREAFESGTRAIIKAYDGELKYEGGNDLNLVSEETIYGSVVRTYSCQLLGYWTDADGVNYGHVRLKSKNTAPKRIDIPNIYDVSIIGNQNTSYNCPYYITSDQMEFSDYCQNGKYVYITNAKGTIKTEWFANSPELRQLRLMGKHINVKGDLLDFANCLKIEYINLYQCYAVTGDMRQFLDACKANGMKSKTIEIRCGLSLVTSDVASGSVLIRATFDSNGDWTAIDIS